MSEVEWVMRARTCIIWSSFLMDSFVGPPDVRPVADETPLSPPPPPSSDGPGGAASEVARERLVSASLGLFVRVGLVWGCVAGE